MSRFAVVCAFLVCLSCHCTKAYFTIPPVTILVFNNDSFSISIPDVEGVEFFLIEGKFKHIYGKKESFTDVSGNVTQPVDGKWIIEKFNIHINRKDEFNYRLYVEHKGFGYYKKFVTYKVEDYFSEDSYIQNGDMPCRLSKTTIDGGAETCKGSIIFEDDFDNEIDPMLWTIEHRLPYEHEYYRSMFVTFQKSNVEIKNGKLSIFPSLLNSLSDWNYDRILSGQIDLGSDCTSSFFNRYCKKTIDKDIVPPVITGKITTKNKFSFKYGTIEVKAKFPTGLWLFPELYLEPVRLSGSYQHRVIRIGFFIGNYKRVDAVNENSGLSGGLFLFDPLSCSVKSNENQINWGLATHTYKMVWDSDKIELYVDGVKYGTIEYSSCRFKRNEYSSIEKLLQEEYFLSFGVGVGGVLDFPDNIDGKTWKNTATKARSHFFNNSSDLDKQWNKRNIKFEIDSVKVSAL